MKTLSELRTSNLAEVTKNTKIKNRRKQWGVIDKRPGLPYVNIYALLYSLKHQDNYTLENAVKKVTECVVYLNNDIDEKLLHDAVRFFIREYVDKGFDSKLSESVISETLGRKVEIIVEENDIARYICKPMVMSKEQMGLAIIKHRTKNVKSSEYATMKAHFHALIDTQFLNWADINEEDFLKVFSKTLVNKYFKSIFEAIYNQRQMSLKKFLQKKRKIAA